MVDDITKLRQEIEQGEKDFLKESKNDSSVIHFDTTKEDKKVEEQVEEQVEEVSKQIEKLSKVVEDIKVDEDDVSTPTFNASNLKGVAIAMISLGIILLVGSFIISSAQSVMEETIDITSLDNNVTATPLLPTVIFPFFSFIAVGAIVFAAFGIVNIFRV